MNTTQKENVSEAFSNASSSSSSPDKMDVLPVSHIARESDVNEALRSPQSAKLDSSETSTPSPTVGKKRTEPNTSPDNEPMKVPKRAEISPGSMQSPVSGVVKYKDRKNARSTILEMKSALESSREWGLTSMEGRRCLIDHYHGDEEADEKGEALVGTQTPVRYMFTTTNMRSAALDARFTQMESEFMTRANLPPEVITLKTAVGIPSQDTVVCFGRICCEATEGGKINVASVLLEGGRMEGGRRIKLILNELPEYALFPGQFVMVEGINTTGNKMIVKKLCEGVPRPLATTKPSTLNQLYYNKTMGHQQGEPLNIMTACGPFTCNDNLEYEPFRDLLFQAAVSDPCDVLILLGPFIDAHHPQISNGMAGFTDNGIYENVDPWTLFLMKISGTIESFFEKYPDLTLQIVLVPSIHDIHHDVVYPQPPFRDRVAGGQPSPFFTNEVLFQLGIPKTEKHHISLFQGNKFEKHVHCIGNPSMIRINEVVIGLSSNDVLFHLSKEEVSLRPPGTHRLEKVVDHLIKQQSFYPLFPATSESLPQDMQFAEKWTMPVSPDILIVPSKLATFAKKLPNGTLALNPGQLAKGAGGGSYAKMTVYPIPADKLQEASALHTSTVKTEEEEEEVALPHHVAERTSVVIKRI